MRGYLASSVVLAAAVLAMPVEAAVLINSNFNTATVGSVSTGATVDGFLTSVVTNTAINVVELAPGQRAVTLTDNLTPSSGSNSAPYLRKSVTGVTTGTLGDNHVTGSFKFTRLSLSTGSEGSFRFLMNTAGSFGTTTAVTLVLLRVNGNTISYSNGATLQSNLLTSLFSPVVGTTYNFEIDANLSSTQQDTWFFRVKSEAGALLYTSDTFNTSLPNGTPGELLFTGGISGAAASTDPFVRLDDIRFDAVPIPEPAMAMTVLTGMSGLVAFRRPRRRD